MKPINGAVLLAFTACGTLAFNEGKERTPCLDANCMGMIEACKFNVGEGIPYFNAWLEAWDDAKQAQVKP